MMKLLAFLLSEAASPPPPPPIVTVGTGSRTGSVPALVSYRAGEVRCAGALQRPLLAEQPLPGGTYLQKEKLPQMEPVLLRFSIDASGRTSNIKAVTGAPSQLYVPVRTSSPHWPPGALARVNREAIARSNSRLRRLR